MARQDVIELGPGSNRGFRGIGSGGWIIVALVLIGSARSIASWWIDYQWWTEVKQAETWGEMILYGWLPSLTAGLLLFPIFWILAAKARRGSGIIRLVLIFLLSLFLGGTLIDNWTVARWLGSSAASTSGQSWVDPVFGRQIGFYFFQLPFYEMMLRFVQGIVV